MSLLDLQRDMMGWLRSADPSLAGRIGGGPGADVYLNNHRASLIACLDGHYPQLRRWMGDEAFEGAAAHHVETAAPTSWTLDAYGADFFSTLDLLYPEDPELSDVARLEWALEQAFVAADADPMSVADLGTVDWDEAVLRLVPSAIILTIDTNADAILLALLEEGSLPEALEHAQNLLVWCADFTPRFRPLNLEESDLIARLVRGAGFADICKILAERHGEAKAVGIAGTYLANWTTAGICLKP